MNRFGLQLLSVMIAFCVSSAHAQIYWPPPDCEVITTPYPASPNFIRAYLSSNPDRSSNPSLSSNPGGAVRICTGYFRGSRNETTYDALGPIKKNGAVCAYERIGGAYPTEDNGPVTEFEFFEGPDLPSYRALAQDPCPDWDSDEFVEVRHVSDELFAEMIPFWRAAVSSADAFDEHVADVPPLPLLQDFRELLGREPQRAIKIVSIMRHPIFGGLSSEYYVQVEDPRDPFQDFDFRLRRGFFGWRILGIDTVYFGR